MPNGFGGRPPYSLEEDYVSGIEGRVANLEQALRNIRELLPLDRDGAPDSYDGTANPVILGIIAEALRESHP